MKKALTTLFCILTMALFGQTEEGKIFNRADYPIKEYTIKADIFDFADFKIELIQARPRDKKSYDSKTIYCRVWLTIKKGNTTVDKLFINNCESLGGCSGLYASGTQARKDYFILSKFGDYDGRILIIDASGKIKSYVGGHYYISADKKYLFSPYNSDLSGLTVYDLSKNRLLFTSDKIDSYFSDFYYSGNQYFAIVSDDVKKANLTRILTFNFNKNELILSSVPDSYIAKAELLRAYNNFGATYGPCECGHTKK